MADRTYLFIDGEYLRRRHHEAMVDFFQVDGDLDIFPLRREAGARRVYFYDCIDEAPLPGETGEVQKTRIAPLQRFLSYVQSLSGFHVKPGTVRRGRKREQKEVDVSMAVDMLTHGFNGTMTKAVLLAGDLDFRPVVEALVRQGVFVEVWYHRNSIAEELHGAADFGREIRFRQLYEWNTTAFKETHRVPMVQTPGGGPAGKLLRAGKIRDWGWSAQLYWLETAQQVPQFSLWIDVPVGRTIRVYDRDENLVERYVAVQYGPIDWEFVVEEARIAGQVQDG
jgi:uncharacterized LabA/DUF88 family protein